MSHSKKIGAFAKTIVKVEETARSWGYKNQKDITTFVNGWVKGFNDAHCSQCQARKKK